MSKKIYKFIFSMLFILMLIINKQEIHAEGLAVGNSIGKNDSMNGGNEGGPSMYRTGWLCLICDENGQKMLNSKVVFFPYLNSMTWASCNGTITTEFFEIPLTSLETGSYLNSVPCFQGSVPGGPILKSYLLQQCDDPTYSSNAHMVAEKYLGVPVAEIDKAIGNGQEIFLQYSPIYWCRLQGQTKQDKGEFWISNSYTWAQVNPAPSWIAVATHRNFPQASSLQYPWFGLGCVSEFKQPGEYWQVGEWQANGLGIGAIKISNSYQIVQVIETPSGNQTRYLTSDSKYTIPDKIGNAVIQPDSGFVSKEHTKTNSASASYSEVKAGCTQIGGLVSGGTFDFLSRQGSTALFLHYKGSEITETKSDTDLMAFELMVRVPGEKESSVNEKRTDKSIEHHSFSDMQNRIESWQASKVYEKELEKQVEVERSLAKDHSYILDQNHGDFDTGNGIWQLYRGEYIDQWVIYPELSGKIWEVTDVIDPNYAYYLCRSHLEGLTLVADRENSGTAGLYLSKTKPFEVGYNGKYGAEQGINTTKTWTDLAPYNYTYVPRWANGTGAYIVVDRYTREKLPHNDNCYGDDPDTKAVELDAFICEEEHYTPWEYVGQPKFTAAASQFYILTGTYGTPFI